MLSKLKQLKKEIQRLRPEIMELKFGCELLEKSINVVHTIYEFIEGIGIETDLENIDIDRFYQTKQYKIIGRPITLEDVLAVLSQEQDYEKIWAIEVDGQFISQNQSDGSPFHESAHWIYGKPLDDQSEETIEFLYKLICNK